MTGASTTSEPQPLARRLALALAGTKVAVHSALLGRYGIHGDEMYFLDCGRHLAAGYVDHGPLVPWIARLVEVTLGDSAAFLRIPSTLAGALTIVLAMLLAAQLGGRRWAQGIAGLCVLVAPVYLRAQSLLSLPAFEPLYWTAASLLALWALSRDARLWLAVGAVAGFGLLNKHTMAVWGVAVLLGMLLSPARTALRRPWPWLGGAMAFLVFLPNLLWQISNGAPTLAFLSSMQSGVLAEIPRSLFVLGQVLYQHPLTLPIWLTGVVFFFRGPGESRFLGWLCGLSFLIFFVLHSKPYYLAPVYPLLYAGGAIAIERWLDRSPTRLRSVRWLRWLVPGALAAGGVLTGLFALPVLPLARADALLTPLTRPVLEDPADLTSEFHEQHGWRELAEGVDDFVGALSSDLQSEVVILAWGYVEAGAVARFSRTAQTRPVLSGHLTWWLWGPGDASDRAIVAVGFDPEDLGEWCPKPQKLMRLGAEAAGEPGGDQSSRQGSRHLAPRWQRDLPIALCEGRGEPIERIWPELQRYEHRPRAQLIR